MSPRLALHFLGSPQIYLDNAPITLERRKMVAFLAYLAIEPGPHARETLSTLLWPDYIQSKSYKNLRQTLWEIQQALGEGWLISDREKIGLSESADIWLDVAQFDSLLDKSRAEQEISLRVPLLVDSVKLYRNHFLTGFSLKDANPFNDWAFTESEDLRHKFSRILTVLSQDYCTLGQADQAIPHARRLVSLDPLNESSHRQLMEIYLQAGQHSAALKQYQTCEQILRKELNLDPQPETRALYKKIRKGEMKPIHVENQTGAIEPRHNLPLQLSNFIGREKDQNEVINLVAKNRLVTLIGTGGIGKTSLSLQVGQKLLGENPNGVWFIALDSLSDPALVPQTVASVFDIRERSDQPIVEQLTDKLRGKTALLIFDNCEHLLDACAQLIIILLRNCPGLRIITSSRESLGVPGEATYHMPPLSVPERDMMVEKLTEYESIRLFIERATLALSSFSLTKENAQIVVEICRKLDGVPLAIELAAARVNILQVDEILEQLDVSFSLLASDSRAALQRHQTLHASMDWSWGLLSEWEQTVMQQLSVFAGGWTLASAQAVCEGDILGLTSALVRKSLIVVNQESGRETRYRFHEMVREYVHEKLVKSAEEEIVRTRHLRYFLHLSEQAEIELRGPSRVDWMERLNDERNNVRAALHWAEKTDVEAGLQLAGGLRRYWESSNLSEGLQWLETFLHKPEAKDLPLARAIALHTYGWLLTWLQQFRPALVVTEESLALFRRAGDHEGETDTLVSLGNIKQFLDEPDAAVEILQQSLAMSQSLNDPWREANSYYYLGWDRRDFQRALVYWEKAQLLYRKVGDQIALANLLGVLGQFRVLNGDIELGEKYLDEALLLWQSNKRANIWENPKIAKSLIALIRGDHEQAHAILEEASLAVKETGNRMSYLWVRVRLGYVALRTGKLDEARDIFVETAQNFRMDGYKIGVVFALEGMAGLYAELDKPEHAARLIGWADAARKEISDARMLLEQADVDKTITACLAKMDEVTFSDAYDDGKKMTLDEAVAYALQER